jgi:hypothetical protein
LSGPSVENGSIGLGKDAVGVKPGKGEARMAGIPSFSAICGEAIDFGW